VLNPHWVTEDIYAILNSRAIAETSGELRLDQLATVLNPRRYPQDRQLFLLDLMRKFDLCFAYPDASATWLVPELLPKQQPDEVAALCAPGELLFEYGYPIVPEGLIPRFIVRSSALSAGSPRWRNEVVLRFEGCLAVVKVDPSRNAVEIDVGGEVRSRRRLLAVIRSDFEALHRSYRFPIRATIPITVDGRTFAVDY
jgi:internalin A